MNEIKEKIEKYIAGHRKMTLATVSSDGSPVAHTVQYVAAGSTVCFFTKPLQRKVMNIRRDPRVGYAIDREYDNWGEIQGVQMMGVAEILEDETERRNVFELFKRRFVQMANTPDAFLDKHLIIRVRPISGRFIDNTVSFGHHDDISY